jgi:Fic family protein
MDIDRFANSPTGQLVPLKVRHGGEEIDYFGFLANPLPDEIPLNAETILAVSEADQALGLLEGLARMLPNKALFVRPIVRREAVSTSALEGTYAGFSEVLEAEAAKSAHPTAEIREVLNYMNTAEQALEWIQDRPITLNLIQQLHSTLVQGTRSDSPDSGRFRTVPVMIGPEGAPPTDAHFIPSPSGIVLEDRMRDWEEWNYREDHIPAVVRTAVSHYQFETIHPFRDGNGRLGRLIAILLLIERGPLSGHLFSLSPYLEAHRGEYGEHLRSVSGEGDYDSWVRFFAEAVRVQADEGHTKAERLLRWRETTVEQLRDAGIKGSAITICENLIGFPVISRTHARDLADVTYRAATLAVEKLVEEGVLVEVAGRSYGKLYFAAQVLDILDA